MLSHIVPVVPGNSIRNYFSENTAKADIDHYQKIVVALSETIRLMKEIDEVIGNHGGWPGAFVTTPI
jgi:hypothetical protein